MSTPNETTCPRCGASFQLASNQLQQAGGRVRCGSCLQVFDASTGEIEFVAPVISDQDDTNPLAQLSVNPMSSADLPVRRRSVSRRDGIIVGLLLLLLLAQLAWRSPANGIDNCLEIGQLIVRKHPEHDNALRLDAKLRNTSDRDLSFPGLELSLHNRFGEIRASRLFLPDDYLHGDWRDAPRLPARSEIQVSLALQDPGHDAVNYTARLRSVTDPAN